MQWIPVIVAAMAPGISLLAYFYWKDRYHSEPVSLVLRLFLFGALTVFPIMVIQRALILALGDNSWLVAFGYSAGIEEFIKWILFMFVVADHDHFDEPYDGIVYAVSISLGFATAENVMYALLSYQSFEALFVRALLPVSAHALFGVIMGYHAGRARFVGHKRHKAWGMSLMLPFLYHGVYDFLLLSTQAWLTGLVIPLMAFMWSRSMVKVRRANERSPFRTVMSDDKIKM